MVGSPSLSKHLVDFQFAHNLYNSLCPNGVSYSNCRIFNQQYIPIFYIKVDIQESEKHEFLIWVGVVRHVQACLNFYLKSLEESLDCHVGFIVLECGSAEISASNNLKTRKRL